MKKHNIIYFLVLTIPWVIFFALSLTPQLVLIKHTQPEEIQLIYKSSLWLIPLGFMLLVLLNSVLAGLFNRKIFTKVNYFILVYNTILVAYLIYLNY